MEENTPARRPDPAHLRISDDDRHKVAEILREAAGDGRIDLDELDERLEQAYAAKTYADLVPITLDLPAHLHPATQPVRRPASSPVLGPKYQSSFAMMSETRRSGPWQIDGHHTATAVMGSVVLDLREAQFGQREVTIHASAIMGGVDIVVNAHTAVIVEGIGIMGEFSEARARVAAQLDDQSPVVRVKGIALMGAVNVKRKGMPGESPRALFRRG